MVMVEVVVRRVVLVEEPVLAVSRLERGRNREQRR